MRKQQTQPIIKRTEYSKEEIDSLLNEVGGKLTQASRQNWLLKHGAIKIYPMGTSQDVRVVQKVDGSFPYSELSNKWEALEKRENGQEYKKRLEVSRSTDVLPELPTDEELEDDTNLEDEDPLYVKELDLFGAEVI